MALLGQAPDPRLDALHPWGPDEALLHSLVHESILEPTRGGVGWRSDVVEGVDLDGDRVRVTLRKGLRWHDGEPVTAADLCATLGVLGDPGSSSPFAPGVQARVRGCEADDERVARVELVEGVDAIHALAVPLVPAHLLPSHAGDPRARHGVGCGPYRARLRPGGWDLEATGDTPYERLRWIAGVPAPVASRLVAEGRALATATADPGSLDALRRAGVPLLPWDRELAWALVLDPSRPPYDDAGIRHAVAALLDVDRLVSVLAGNEAPEWPRVSGPFRSGDVGENQALPPLTRDLDRAAARLAEAGYVRGLDRRWVDPRGAPLVLRLGVPDGLGFAPEAVATAFLGSGLTVEVVPIDRGSWVQGVLGGGHRDSLDAVLVPRDLHRDGDPVAWFHSRGPGAGWSNPFDDGALDALVREAHDAQAMRRLHGALHDEGTWWFLVEERRPSAWSRVHAPWWGSAAGWGRIDAWGPPQARSAAP